MLNERNIQQNIGPVQQLRPQILYTITLEPVDGPRKPVGSRRGCSGVIKSLAADAAVAIVYGGVAAQFAPTDPQGIVYGIVAGVAAAAAREVVTPVAHRIFHR
jgi:hypothetical protein